ncbi:hypothetical protein MRX96_003332 [Rhipicephalus microplus]
MIINCVRVDILVHGALRMVDFHGRCSAAVDSGGKCSCVCHPCGCTVQEGGNVNVATGTRLAPISIHWVTFMAPTMD